MKRNVEQYLYAKMKESIKQRVEERAEELQATKRLMIPKTAYIEQEVNQAVRDFSQTVEAAKVILARAISVLRKELEVLPSLEKEEIKRHFARMEKLLENDAAVDRLLGATASLQEVCEIRDEVLLWIYHIGYQHVLSKHYEEAESLFSLLTVFNAFVADYWLALGIAQFEGEKPLEGIKSLLIAKELNPSDPHIYLSLAKIHEGQGDMSTAKVEVDQARRLVEKGDFSASLRREVLTVKERIGNYQQREVQ